MKILTFLAREFRWKTFSKTLEEAEDLDISDGVEQAVVAFFHIESRDCEEEPRVFRHALKHLKWLANKRELKNVVLHSFTHLGGDTADPAFARAFFDRLAERLESTGYAVKQTPFGYFCEWSLDVYGESLAKVFKEI